MDKSGNSNWFTQIKKKNRVTPVLPLRIVDNTGLDQIKTVGIYMKNILAEDDFGVRPWKVFRMAHGEKHYFDFTGPSYSRILGFTHDSGRTWRRIVATRGKKYTINSSDDGISVSNGSSPTEYQVENLTGADFTANMYLQGSLLESQNVTRRGGTFAFRYNPTFWIGANLSAFDPLAINLVNTEISVLGIGGADVVMTYSGAFSFSLQNIVFA